MGENERSVEENGENQRSEEELSQNESTDKDSDEEMGVKQGPRCIVSDPAQPHNVYQDDRARTKHKCFLCGKKRRPCPVNRYNRIHYFCTVCGLEFHEKCFDFPSKMIHPQHPLTFTFLNDETGVIVDTNFLEFYNVLHSAAADLTLVRYLQTTKPNSSTIFDKCTWCGKDLRTWFYRCSICNFSLDFHCALKDPPLTIQNPKSHHHPLVLFPRSLSFPCYACGLINMSAPSYACCQCNYFVHESCIDLPRVIKITRHPHRLSHTPYLPPKESLCRVCYKNVDIKYGQYSCNHEDCYYVVHSICAMHKKVWGGRELEWQPEESDEAKDIAPYKKVGVRPYKRLQEAMSRLYAFYQLL